MRTTVEKPPLPHLWLDTHAISTLVKEAELAKAILDLRESGKLLIVETDQLMEIQPRPELVEPLRDLLTRLSQNQRSHYQQPREVQLQLGMKAHIEGTSDLQVPWNSAFVEDPFKDRSLGGLWIRADIPSTPEQIAAVRQGNQRVAQEMESMRQELMSGGKSEEDRYKEQLEKELKGRANLFLQIMARLLVRLEDGSLSEDDVLTSLDLVGAPMSISSSDQVWQPCVTGRARGTRKCRRGTRAPTPAAARTPLTCRASPRSVRVPDPPWS